MRPHFEQMWQIDAWPFSLYAPSLFGGWKMTHWESWREIFQSNTDWSGAMAIPVLGLGSLALGFWNAIRWPLPGPAGTCRRALLSRLRSLDEAHRHSRGPSTESVVETWKSSPGLVLSNDQNHEPLGRILSCPIKVKRRGKKKRKKQQRAQPVLSNWGAISSPS